MSNTGDITRSSPLWAAGAATGRPPHEICDEDSNDSEIEYLRDHKIIRESRLASIDWHKQKHEINKQLGKTMSETPLSIIPETLFSDSEAENPFAASVGDGSRDGEPDPVKAMEIDGEANWGVEEEYLEMFQLLMPRWFPPAKPTVPLAAGGDGGVEVRDPSDSDQLAHSPTNSCVSDGEANWGVEEEYLEMFQLLMPRWFPPAKPTVPLAAGGDGGEDAIFGSDSAQCVSSSR